MSSVEKDQEGTFEPMDQNTTAPIESWTKEEKFELYQAIKSFNTDIDKIAECIPSKTKEQVIKAMKYYKGVANKCFNNSSRSMMTKKFIEKKMAEEGQLPLAYWAKLLMDHKNLSSLQTDTAAALRLIADLEPIPSKICSSGIDFRTLYKLVADAIDGRPLLSNADHAIIIEKALVETALLSKTFIKPLKLNFIFEEMCKALNVEHSIASFPTANSNQERKLLKQLINTGNCNPFNFDEENLRSDTGGWAFRL